MNIFSTKEAKITKVATMITKQEKACGLNTVELMKICSKEHKIPSDQTMKAAEELYRQGAISYPRTESTSYSENFNFEEVVGFLAHNKEFESKCEVLIEEDKYEPGNGSDSGDHPPITPVGELNEDGKTFLLL